MSEGRIITSISGYYDIQTADGIVHRTRARGKFRKHKQSPVVGDIVTFEVGDGISDGRLVSIKARRNELQRPAVANIDQLIIVMSMKTPDFSTYLLDRFIVEAIAKNITPILYWSKWDLLNDEESEAMYDIYQRYTKLGYPVYRSQNDDDLAKLQAQLVDKVSAVMGQSGAGKSTLLNTLVPDLQLKTGDVSEVLGRGRHTTRQTTLLDVHGGLVADTPGFSALDFQSMDVHTLSMCFEEFAPYAKSCKFRTCTHTHEPKCMVKEAVAHGDINQERYDHYLQFIEELKD